MSDESRHSPKPRGDTFGALPHTWHFGRGSLAVLVSLPEQESRPVQALPYCCAGVPAWSVPAVVG